MEEVLAGVLHALANRFWRLVRLAEAHANGAVTVAHDGERVVTNPSTALTDTHDAVELDYLLLKFVVGIPVVVSTPTAPVVLSQAVSP